MLSYCRRLNFLHFAFYLFIIIQKTCILNNHWHDQKEIKGHDPPKSSKKYIRESGRVELFKAFELEQ